MQCCAAFTGSRLLGRFSGSNSSILLMKSRAPSETFSWAVRSAVSLEGWWLLSGGCTMTPREWDGPLEGRVDSMKSTHHKHHETSVLLKSGFDVVFRKPRLISEWKHLRTIWNHQKKNSKIGMTTTARISPRLHICTCCFIVHRSIGLSTSIGNFVRHISSEQLMCHNAQTEDVAAVIKTSTTGKMHPLTGHLDAKASNPSQQPILYAALCTLDRSTLLSSHGCQSEESVFTSWRASLRIGQLQKTYVCTFHHISTYCQTSYFQQSQKASTLVSSATKVLERRPSIQSMTSGAIVWGVPAGIGPTSPGECLKLHHDELSSWVHWTGTRFIGTFLFVMNLTRLYEETSGVWTKSRCWGCRVSATPRSIKTKWGGPLGARSIKFSSLTSLWIRDSWDIVATKAMTRHLQGGWHNSQVYIEDRVKKQESGVLYLIIAMDKSSCWSNSLSAPSPVSWCKWRKAYSAWCKSSAT